MSVNQFAKNNMYFSIPFKLITTTNIFLLKKGCHKSIFSSFLTRISWGAILPLWVVREKCDK